MHLFIENIPERNLWQTHTYKKRLKKKSKDGAATQNGYPPKRLRAEQTVTEFLTERATRLRAQLHSRK